MFRFPEKNIFTINSDKEFSTLALQIFEYQAAENPVYQNYIKHLEIDPGRIHSVDEIPFLPIRFFKSTPIISGKSKAKLVFTSSGTTGSGTSRHGVVNPAIYEKSLLESFRLFYGHPNQYEFLALLPSYFEQTGSSLLYMVQCLMQESHGSHSGFYLNNLSKLTAKIAYLKKESSRKIFVIGVSFALIDLAEQFAPDLSSAIVMETGGMKGRRKEITREELHEILCKKFNLTRIDSEYGMTELLSQAYSKRKGIFYSPPWMQIKIRDPYDPFHFFKSGKTGALNLIDLANIHSCSFIETDDLGKRHNDNSFEVLGRFDHSDIRGCNLMVN